MKYGIKHVSYLQEREICVYYNSMVLSTEEDCIIRSIIGGSFWIQLLVELFHLLFKMNS